MRRSWTRYSLCIAFATEGGLCACTRARATLLRRSKGRKRSWSEDSPLKGDSALPVKVPRGSKDRITVGTTGGSLENTDLNRYGIVGILATEWHREGDGGD